MTTTATISTAILLIALVVGAMSAETPEIALPCLIIIAICTLFVGKHDPRKSKEDIKLQE